MLAFCSVRYRRNCVDIRHGIYDYKTKTTWNSEQKLLLRVVTETQQPLKEFMDSLEEFIEWYKDTEMDQVASRKWIDKQPETVRLRWGRGIICFEIATIPDKSVYIRKRYLCHTGIWYLQLVSCPSALEWCWFFWRRKFNSLSTYL
jgi:hypothetical protein